MVVDNPFEVIALVFDLFDGGISLFDPRGAPARSGLPGRESALGKPERPNAVVTLATTSHRAWLIPLAFPSWQLEGRE